METTTIQIDRALREKLESIKLHRRETYNELILRLIEQSPLETASRESLIATIELMSNSELMKEIARGLQEYEKGEGVDFEDLKRELKINV